MSGQKRKKANQKTRGKPNSKTGVIGVCKVRGKYQAETTIDGIHHYLGTFKTKVEAGVAYDRFVIDKSNKKLTYALNYPNMTDEQQHPYHVGQKIEVYYSEPGTTQRWFKATIKAYHNDGIQIYWTGHKSLYKISNDDVNSLIRLVGEDKEVEEEENEEEELPVDAKTLYPVGKQVEVYYPEPETTQRWFKATINAYLDDGVQIHWAVHDSLYVVKNGDVKSLIRLVGGNKETCGLDEDLEGAWTWTGGWWWETKKPMSAGIISLKLCFEKTN